MKRWAWKAEVSLSFLPESDRFAHFLQASLEVMQAECPPAHNRLCELLEGRQVCISVDGEEVYLSFAEDSIVVLPGVPSDPMVALIVSRQTILDLVDGFTNLQDGIIDGRVGVQGGIQELLLFHEGWLTYLRGAARCPSFPYLLERFSYATNSLTAEQL
jgi:hypothetical protein